MTTVEVQVTVHDEVIREIARGPELREFLLRTVSEFASELRADAPVRTGAGRRSIVAKVEMGATGWYGTASWDDAHYYLGIQNSRTRWAQPTLSRVRYV